MKNFSNHFFCFVFTIRNLNLIRIFTNKFTNLYRIKQLRGTVTCIGVHKFSHIHRLYFQGAWDVEQT